MSVKKSTVFSGLAVSPFFVTLVKTMCPIMRGQQLCNPIDDNSSNPAGILPLWSRVLVISIVVYSYLYDCICAPSCARNRKVNYVEENLSYGNWADI